MNLLKVYLKELHQGDRYSPATLRLTTTWLQNLERFLADKPVDLVRPQDLSDWRRELTWQPNRKGRFYSENTLNQAVGVVRRFFEWAVAEGHLKEDPSTHLKTRRVPDKPQHLSETTKRKILTMPDLDTLTGIRDRAVLGLLLEVSISRKACSELDLEHLQLDTGALRAGGRRGGIYCLSESLLGDLGFYLEHARPALALGQARALFLNQRGERMSAASIQQLFRRCVKQSQQAH